MVESGRFSTAEVEFNISRLAITELEILIADNTPFVLCIVNNIDKFNITTRGSFIFVGFRSMILVRLCNQPNATKYSSGINNEIWPTSIGSDIQISTVVRCQSIIYRVTNSSAEVG